MSDKKFSVSRDFKKQTLSVEPEASRLNNSEKKIEVAKVDRREALKSLAPSVGKSLTGFLREFKMMVHEVTDKIKKA